MHQQHVVRHMAQLLLPKYRGEYREPAAPDKRHLPSRRPVAQRLIG